MYTHLKTIALSFSLLNGISLIAQNTLPLSKIWVSVNNLGILPQNNTNGSLVTDSEGFQRLINDHEIISCEQIIPSSKNSDLLKVYELTCHCDQGELIDQIRQFGNDLSNPEPAPEYQPLFTTNDYNLAFDEDYALDNIGAQTAWNITTGDTSVELAISDSNFDLDHEELVGSISHIEYPLTNPNYYHGTAVAITAAGNTNNGMGKSSIGSDCMLQLYSMGYNHLLTATYNDAKVINVSWAGSCSYSSYAQNIINEVYNNGSIVVASAGNGSTCGGASNLVYPAAYNHVISVTSVGPSDNHERIIGNPATTHQHNATVDIAAPGYDVALTVSNGWYLTGNGTSFAAPYVTGTIGLMLSVNPCLSFEDVQTILSETADDLDSLNPSYAGGLGAGRLNAGDAVTMAASYNTFSIMTSSDPGIGFMNGSAIVASVDIEAVAPLSYNWSTGETTSEITELGPGIYYVLVTDALGCTGTDSAIVVLSDSLGIGYFESSITAWDIPENSNEITNSGIIEDHLSLSETLTFATSYSLSTNSERTGNSTDGLLLTESLQEFIGFEIYPNPAQSGSTNIRWTSGDVNRINISDLNGKVLTTTFFNESDDSMFLSDLSCGVYLVHVHSNSGTIATSRLVVPE